MGVASPDYKACPKGREDFFRRFGGSRRGPVMKGKWRTTRGRPTGDALITLVVPHPGDPKMKKRRFNPAFESFEDRLALSTLTIVNDSTKGVYLQLVRHIPATSGQLNDGTSFEAPTPAYTEWTGSYRIALGVFRISAQRVIPRRTYVCLKEARATSN